jgi:hypothetical protein
LKANRRSWFAKGSSSPRPAILRCSSSFWIGFYQKERPVKIDLPPIEHHRDLTAAYAAIVRAVGAGELTPGEGSAVAALIVSIARYIDDAEVEVRLCSLEKELKYLQAKS